MRIEVKGLRELSVLNNVEDPKIIPPGWVNVRVLHCAICRTDAKIWNEGHRDLSLPVVPGHEMVVEYLGKKYVVWPGVICGTCDFCISGRDNLCEDIQIIGFHHDGGFASRVAVPRQNLIELPDSIPSLLGTFSEPVGCVANAVDKMQLRRNDRVLVYGAGTIGLLAAFYLKSKGAKSVILEKSAVKIEKARVFGDRTGVEILQNTNAGNFDRVLNACADPAAFAEGIAKVAKGGTYVFFSGLSKNKKLDTNLLNLIHYKELTVVGAYGLKQSNMHEGVRFIENYFEFLEHLTEAVISPRELPQSIEAVLTGMPYKYIVDFSLHKAQISNSDLIKSEELENSFNYKKTNYQIMNFTIKKTSESLLTSARHKMDMKTKPLGSLGRLEDLAIQMSGVQNTLFPEIKRKASFVFAADHGVVEEGVSAFPQEVTQQMVLNFLNNGAAINVLCAHNNIDISIIDAGIKGEMARHDKLINKKVAHGTRNFAHTMAMTREEAEAAINVGVAVFEEKNKAGKIDVLGIGEMGIGNTSAATAIIAAATGVSVEQCAGRGTGVDDEAFKHKIGVIEKALKFHQPDSKDAMDILCKIGGFEIAAMSGAALKAASTGCAVVLDGVISTAAGVIAYLINPDVAQYFISGHKSVEVGQKAALDLLCIKPVLDLDFRLGEGTGAALAINIVEAACKIMCEMATFEEANVSGAEK